jgi:cell division protein FtsI/penicillin-binding protein 2
MNLSSKTNQVLCFIFVCMLLILIKVWYLSIFQHEHYVKQSLKTKTVIEQPPRATIQDRFGIPLAINKIQYNVSVCYSYISQQIPRTKWEEETPGGKKFKQFPRAKYIDKLASYLSEELQMDSKKIEDLIHSTATLIPHLPCTIKENIPEKQYYKLRMLERQWPGLLATQSTRRCYPLDKTACDIIGYLGNIDRTQYLKIAHELHLLEQYFLEKKRGENPFLPEGFHTPEAAFKRLADLKEKSYTIDALVGKQGVEASYDEILRGYRKKNVYEIDVTGNVLRKTAESTPSTPGKKITLSISAELQNFSEKLLSAMTGPQANKEEINENWLKNGAIVAMIPQTGEIVALASYPRFNPNDFIPTQDPLLKKEKTKAIQKWLETDEYLGEIWDGKVPMEREYFSFSKGKYIQEKLPLSWNLFIQTILPIKGPVKDAMASINTIFLAVQIQEKGICHPILERVPSLKDRLLIIDLCHLIAPKEPFSTEILEAIGNLSLQEYHERKQHFMQIFSSVKDLVKQYFHDIDFAIWRNENFAKYLKEKRKEEKTKKKYTRPYTDYLMAIENKLFKNFWKTYKSPFLYTAITKSIPIDLQQYPHLAPYLQKLQKAQSINSFLKQYLEKLSPSLAISYLQTFRPYEELTTPLQTNYPRLRSSQGIQLEKHLATSFYPQHGYSFMKSLCYKQATPPGSVFKLVTAYESLIQQYQNKKALNPLTIIDNSGPSRSSNFRKQIVGHFLDKTPIYRYYKNGLLPRSYRSEIGRVDLPRAIECTSNVYFAMLAGDCIENPEDLAAAAKKMGFGEKTGIDLPYEASGHIPQDLNENKTNLYSFAIGQHSLEVTPLQTAIALSAIATQGSIVKPFVVKRIEGEELFYDTPVQVKNTIPFPDEILTLITQGMHRVVTGSQGTGRPSVIKPIYDYPISLNDYRVIHPYLLAKTGTAQVMYKQSVVKTEPSSMKCHGRFVSIAYPKALTESDLPPKNPELVVVAFLQFAKSGTEGAPIVGQVVKKWREIKKNHHQ